MSVSTIYNKYDKSLVPDRDHSIITHIKVPHWATGFVLIDGNEIRYTYGDLPRQIIINVEGTLVNAAVRLNADTSEVILHQYSVEEIRKLNEQIRLFECGKIQKVTWGDNVGYKLRELLRDYSCNWGRRRCNKDLACAITECKNSHSDQPEVPYHDDMSNVELAELLFEYYASAQARINTCNTDYDCFVRIVSNTGDLNKYRYAKSTCTKKKCSHNHIKARRCALGLLCNIQLCPYRHTQ